MEMKLSRSLEQVLHPPFLLFLGESESMTGSSKAALDLTDFTLWSCDALPCGEKT